MQQSYKVFIEDKPLLITATANSTEIPKGHGIRIVEPSKHEIYTVCKRLKEEDIDFVVLVSSSTKSTFDELQEAYVIAAAAGGLVMDSKNRCLIMLRNGKWDLPKGKIELGESIEEAALREVEEECGLRNLDLGEAIITTYHTYDRKGKSYFKPSYWFRMSIPDIQEGIAQTEEGITELKWVNFEELNYYASQSYFTIQLVVESFLNHPKP